MDTITIAIELARALIELSSEDIRPMILGIIITFLAFFILCRGKHWLQRQNIQKYVDISLLSRTDIISLNCGSDSPEVSLALQITNHAEKFYCEKVTVKLNIENATLELTQDIHLDVMAQSTTSSMFLRKEISERNIGKLKKIIQKAIEKDGNYAMQNINYSLEIEATCKIKGKTFILRESMQSCRNLYFVNLNSLLNTAF